MESRNLFWVQFTKKKFQLQHVPDPVPSPTLLEASQPRKMYIIKFIHECWFGIYHLLVSIKNQKRLIVLRSKSADTSGIHGTDRNFESLLSDRPSNNK
jgi:hypothetical protein